MVLYLSYYTTLGRFASLKGPVNYTGWSKVTLWVDDRLSWWAYTKCWRGGYGLRVHYITSLLQHCVSSDYTWTSVLGEILVQWTKLKLLLHLQMWMLYLICKHDDVVVFNETQEWWHIADTGKKLMCHGSLLLSPVFLLGYRNQVF